MVNSFFLQTLLLILSAFEIWMSVCFLELLCGKQLLTKQKFILLIFSVLVGVVLTVNRNLIFFSSLMLCIAIIMTLLIIVWLFRSCFLIALEIVIIYHALITLIDFTFAFLFVCVLNGNFWNNVYIGNISWNSIAIFLCTRLIVFGGFVLFRKFKVGDLREYKWILLPICGVLYVLVLFFQILLETISSGKYDMKGWVAAISLTACLILLIFLTFFVLRFTNVKSEINVLKMRDEMLNLEYQDIKERTEITNQLVHDIRNHIIALQGLCDLHDFVGATNYLSQMNKDFSIGKKRLYTDNVMLNVILNEKLNDLNDIKVDINCKGHIKLPINERDVVSIFGNLLDNALEACNKIETGTKEIAIVMEEKGNMFFLEITNTICKKPDIKNNTIFTTKNSNGNHGYGLKNIRQAVERYNGVLLLSADERIFRANITLFI